MACPTCKLRVFAPASLYALNHSKVAAKYHEHGIDHRFASWETVDRSYQVGEKLVSADPLVLQLTIPMGDDEEQVTIEGGLAVCDSAA